MPREWLVLTLGHEVLRGFRDGEKHDTDNEFDQRDSSHDDHKLPPSHIVGSRAGDRCLLTSEVS